MHLGIIGSYHPVKDEVGTKIKQQTHAAKFQESAVQSDNENLDQNAAQRMTVGDESKENAGSFVEMTQVASGDHEDLNSGNDEGNIGYVRRQSSYFNSNRSRADRDLRRPARFESESNASTLKKKAQQKRKNEDCLACTQAARKAGIAPISIVAVWITAGTMFYHYYTGFYWSQAFFYAVDTGFSIGFGMFVEGAWNDTTITIPAGGCVFESCSTTNMSWTGSLREACVQLQYRPDTASMAYTVVHILVGSSLVATALTMMLVGTLDRSGVTEQKEKVLKKNLDREKIKKTLELQKRRMYKFVADAPSENQRRREACDECMKKARNSMQGYWKAFVALTQLQLFKATCALVCWVSGGVIFGVFTEKWSFMEGLYFAISSLSTAGLLGPTHHLNGSETFESCNGDCQTLAMTITGIYCFVGVPLFAMVLGSAADFQIDRMMELRMQSKIQAGIGASEFIFARDKLVGSGHVHKNKEFISFISASTQTGNVDEIDTNILKETSRSAEFDSLLKSIGQLSAVGKVASTEKTDGDQSTHHIEHTNKKSGNKRKHFILKANAKRWLRNRADGNEFVVPVRSRSRTITIPVPRLDFLQYLQLTLLRTGILEETKLHKIWEQFRLIDADDSGDVTLSEVAAMNIFNKYDVDNSASLDILEFFLCVDDLRHNFPNVDYATDEEDLSLIFLKISHMMVDKHGYIHVPVDLENYLNSWLLMDQIKRDEIVRSKVITRLQFLMWCKDKVPKDLDSMVYSDEDDDDNSDDRQSNHKTMRNASKKIADSHVDSVASAASVPLSLDTIEIQEEDNAI